MSSFLVTLISVVIQVVALVSRILAYFAVLSPRPPFLILLLGDAFTGVTTLRFGEHLAPSGVRRVKPT